MADFTEEGRTFAMGLAEGTAWPPIAGTEPLRQQLQAILTNTLDAGSTHLTRDVIPTAETATEAAADHAIQQAEAAAGRVLVQGAAQLRGALAEGLQGGAESGIDGLRTELATTRRWATGLGIGLAVTATALAVYLVRAHRNAVMETKARTTITRRITPEGRRFTRATSTARTRRV